MEAASSFPCFFLRWRLGVGKLWSFVIAQCWRMMTGELCRQNNASQRQTSHCSSLEHQKPILKTQWGLVHILVFKARRIKVTKSRAKQNTTLYVWKGEELGHFSFLFSPVKWALNGVDYIAENERIFHPLKVLGSAHLSLEGACGNFCTCQGALHPVLKGGLCDKSQDLIATPFTYCVTYGEFLNFSEPYSHLTAQ